jgi:hypothetical protein
MALTQGAWSTSTVNGTNVMTCTVTATTSENDSYTLKTPEELDGSRPFTLIANAAGATLDGSTLPVEIWVGTSSSAALSGDGGSVAGTDAYVFKDIIADVKAAVGTCICDPTLTTADVANVHVKVPSAPYYIFHLDGASTLAAADCKWIIVQDAVGQNDGLVSSDIGGVGADPS